MSRITLSDLLDALEAEFGTLESASLEQAGICTFCGEIDYGPLEPDARNYVCEACGASAVFGVEELLVQFA